MIPFYFLFTYIDADVYNSLHKVSKKTNKTYNPLRITAIMNPKKCYHQS